MAVAILQLRTGDGAWWPVVFWMALAGLTPTGLMLAATVALTCCLAPGPGRSRVVCAALSLGAAVLAALPWLVASVAAGSLSSSQASGVTAFAARAEPGLGTLFSLAGLGGIWNAQAVPSSRTTLFAVVATVVLLAVVAVGLPSALRRAGAVPLLALAAVAVVVPALMATGPGLAVVEATVRTLPGLGVLRDAQKWVALAMPGYALAGAGCGRHAASSSARCRHRRRVLPGAAGGPAGFGLGGWRQGCLGPVPAELGGGGRAHQRRPPPVVVLPPDSLREFAWAGPAPVLDPLPRWVSADVLTTGDLVIGGQVVPGEGERARDAAAAGELRRHRRRRGASRCRLGGRGVPDGDAARCRWPTAVTP